MEEEKDIGCNFCKARFDSIFSSLTTDKLCQLDQIKQCQFHKKGDVLFQEGSNPKGLYCVQSGKIKITQLGDDGKEQIVHLVHDGDVMGYRAILRDDVYSCSAKAIEDSYVCFIPKAAFTTMVENDAKLALKIVHVLSDELKDAEKKITHTAQRPVKDRIAEALLHLIKNYGMDADKVTINVTIKREDLANLAGTTRETATRFLYEFQEEKIIELVGKKIKIIDEAKLIQIAHSF